MNTHPGDTMTTSDQVTVHHDDCLTALRAMPDASVSAIVTDPPYGLSNTDPASVADTITKWATGDREHVPTGRGFMGKAWDAFVPPPAVWDECLRVLKPGGHMVVFAGSRTQDLMGLSIRLAGFDIRDSVAWLYGSGFPKSMDVSKSIDKGQGKNRERQLEFTAWMRSTGITSTTISEATGTSMASHYLSGGTQPAIATADMFDRLRPHLPEVPERIERLVAERTGIEWKDYVKRPITQHATAEHRPGDHIRFDQRSSADRERRDVPASSEASAWQGWGTALKPAHEPVIVARKPLEGTVAGNVLEHGTGALNIDACRAGSTGEKLGRWPANVVLDESQAAVLDQQAPATGGSGKASGPSLRGKTAAGVAFGARNGLDGDPAFYGDKGGASRFFYTAKAPKSERPVVDGTAHPTVKPLAIMRWLIRLITPPEGMVLDPFAGSGTTIEAAILEGFPVTGIEREADYLPLIQARIDRAALAN